MLIRSVGAADETVDLEGCRICQSLKTGLPAARSLQNRIIQVRAKGSEGQRCQSLLSDLIGGDWSDIQHG